LASTARASTTSPSAVSGRSPGAALLAGIGAVGSAARRRRSTAFTWRVISQAMNRHSASTPTCQKMAGCWTSRHSSIRSSAI
jgi:hypothetical protein